MKHKITIFTSKNKPRESFEDFNAKHKTKKGQYLIYIKINIVFVDDEKHTSLSIFHIKVSWLIMDVLITSFSCSVIK